LVAAPESDAIEIFAMMRRPTKVISRKNGDIRIIKITGRLDPGDGPDQLFDMVQRFAEENEIDFLLDLRSVTYISSTGVGSLIKCYRTVLKQKGHVKLLSPSQSVRNILAISKLDGVFEIFSDEAEALTSFNEKAPEKEAKTRKSK
jgi:anti-sigma B factor antagonist